jgi:UDP-MurNAc hydroxylase
LGHAILAWQAASQREPMRVTYLGHAGLFIETRRGSILCDPWFSPAYFASWFPFPSNEGVDRDQLAHPDFLYVSHLHRDHFDPAFLRDHVSRAATVLLPDFPLDELRRELAELGFSRFELLVDREPVDLDGLRVMGVTEVSPSDGPLGDSALAVDDRTARLLDQNDARPRDLEAIGAFGPYDAHFLQFSGAIWFPVVYTFPEAEKAALGREKRARGMDRALRFVEGVGARYVFPTAGPPCFLDDALFAHNDLDGDETNPFPDQAVFLGYLEAHGRSGGRLVVPGSQASLVGGTCEVRHPAGEAAAMAPFRAKREYLESYQARERPAIEAERRSWQSLEGPSPGEMGPSPGEVVAALSAWWEPLLRSAHHLCDGVGMPVLLRVGDVAVVVDFPARAVRAWEGERCPYRFSFEPGPFLTSIRDRCEDWINGLFLSMRFSVERDVGYNEQLYTFFKCLSPERLAYADAAAAGTLPARARPEARGSTRSRERTAADEDQWCEIGGWRVQRRCPHLQGDLSRFGRIDDGTLTCQLHGWRFDLATGHCLSTEGGPTLRAERVEVPEPAPSERG